jgi:hypothetical protein
MPSADMVIKQPDKVVSKPVMTCRILSPYPTVEPNRYACTQLPTVMDTKVFCAVLHVGLTHSIRMARLILGIKIHQS